MTSGETLISSPSLKPSDQNSISYLGFIKLVCWSENRLVLVVIDLRIFNTKQKLRKTCVGYRDFSDLELWFLGIHGQISWNSRTNFLEFMNSFPNLGTWWQVCGGNIDFERGHMTWWWDPMMWHNNVTLWKFFKSPDLFEFVIFGALLAAGWKDVGPKVCQVSP